MLITDLHITTILLLYTYTNVIPTYQLAYSIFTFSSCIFLSLFSNYLYNVIL